MKHDKTKPVRCAVYTRKSTEEGLKQDFNSLDSQRLYCEEFIKTQSSEGWVCLPDRFDDGGYSGGNLNRPAFKKLMAEVEAGRIDVIVAYKFERLSRSMRDFLNLMDVLEKKGVKFASATQPVNSTTSAGRLNINAMMMVAQFERENASERTRDKIAASRKLGKWAGGRPILGYDIDRETKRLVVNEAEAEQVRQIFALYLNHESIMAVVRELERRGWKNKRWITSKNTTMGGRAFDKASLYKLLQNDAYVGLVRHKEQRFPGEHKAIVDAGNFRRVQEILKRNGRTGGAIVRNKYNALLKGLLTCSCCQRVMGHSYSSKAGRVKYRYYLCGRAAKSGWHSCPAPSVPAGEIEDYVIESIGEIANDRTLVAETLKHARRDVPTITYADVANGFERFSDLWRQLAPHEQSKVVRQLIRGIEWDGRVGQIQITFNPIGLATLTHQTRIESEQAA